MEVAKVLRAELTGAGAQPFPAISIDTRTLKPGDIFWALKGPNFDGHDFVEVALKKQASGAVVNLEWYRKHSVDSKDKIFLEVDDTGTALTRLAAWWRKRMNIPVVAITGSIGKTTTKDWAAAILSKRYRVFKTPGNRNNLVGLPLAMIDLALYHQIAVMEMGANHEGEIAQLCRIVAPTHGLITRIAPVHLEGFGDIGGVIRAKSELYKYLEADGEILAPAHDPVVMNLVKGKEIIGFGLGDPPSDTTFKDYYRVDIIGHSKLGQPILKIEGHRATLKAVGDLWIPAAVAAAAIARTFEIPVRDIVEVLSEIEPGPGRLKSFNIDEIEIWDDTYNSNPESLKAAIELLCSRPAKRRILVVGDMMELGSTEEELHRNIGTFLQDRPVDALFTIGQRASWIAESIPKNTRIKIEIFQEHEPLIKHLKKLLKPGDAVLFKASRTIFLEQVVIALFPGIAKHYQGIEH